MSDVLEHLAVRAATIDELLSDAFQPLPGRKADADVAARRLAAWCRSAASGDWALFSRRLARDGLTMEQVMQRLAHVRINPAFPKPQWLTDASWVFEMLCQPCNSGSVPWLDAEKPLPFQDLFIQLVQAAEKMRDESLAARVTAHLTSDAHASLKQQLLSGLVRLCGAALYERFSEFRKENNTSNAEPNPQDKAARGCYDTFVKATQTVGWEQLLDAKPVLLRLMASLCRQWMNTTGEFLRRLDEDIAAVRRDVMQLDAGSRVSAVQYGLSDPHNGGHSVYIVRFEDDSAVVYKPKDLRADACWAETVNALNALNPPVDLRAARTLARDGYGWTEFIRYGDCTTIQEATRFFQREGAWLALLHIFAGTDMHEENMIAAGEHPVPIDMEMILQAEGANNDTDAPPMAAYEAANRMLSASVLQTGLLPSFSRSPDTSVLDLGGLNNRALHQIEESWRDINTDAMTPVRIRTLGPETNNLPKLDGERISLENFRDDLVAGFDAYIRFLSKNRQSLLAQGCIDKFSGIRIRRVLKPTRFYFMLIDRLRDHRHMHDGAEWSTHLDFIARMSNWDEATEPLWPLLAAERNALSQLNVPFFVCQSDGAIVSDVSGISARTVYQPGLSRARARLESLNDSEVAWQSEVVRLSTISMSAENNVSPASVRSVEVVSEDAASLLARSADIARQFSEWAIRKEGSAAWLALDWLGESESCQLVPLKYDLYGGAAGVALYLAAHAKVAQCETSRELALAALSATRHNLRRATAARFSRGLGIGGAAGLGSIVYAFTVISRSLSDEGLMQDAKLAAALFTDDLIAADSALDIVGGAAGAILCLLKLHRECGDATVLSTAVKCGEHLLQQRSPDSGGK